MQSLYRILIIAVLQAISLDGLTQKDKPRFIDDPIWTDSASTLFIPTRYSDRLITSDKLASSGGYFANILVYDFIRDSWEKLFKEDTYIKDFRHTVHYPQRADTLANMSAKWVFLLVKNNDFNRNGRIDAMDPSTLYVVGRRGENLRPVTPKNEHAISFQIFEKQGFALVKLQRDSNYDELFDGSDKDIYLRRIDLTHCSLGRPIEAGHAEKRGE